MADITVEIIETNIGADLVDGDTIEATVARTPIAVTLSPLTEVDPIFTAHEAFNVTAGDIKLLGDLSSLAMIDGNFIIGDGGITNYAAFAADGELTLFGTARVTRSVYLEPKAGARPASNPPGEGLEDEFPTHDFDASTDESVFYHWELPRDYAVAGNMNIHFEFFVDSAPADAKSVVWGIEYKKQSIGDNFDFGAGTTTAYDQESITTGTPANDKKIHRSSGITLTTTGFAAGDFLLLRLFRDADGIGGTDDFAADARVINYHLEYLSDRLGEAT